MLNTNHELKNRFMHVDYAADDYFQSANANIRSLNLTLCAVLCKSRQFKKNLSVKKQELADATVKRLMKFLQDKNRICRESGKWEVLV